MYRKYRTKKNIIYLKRTFSSVKSEKKRKEKNNISYRC